MERKHYIQQIKKGFRANPAIALLGPRQCGKTTLARTYAENQLKKKPENYFDLERESHLARLTQPEVTLSKLSGLIIIDEIQRIPELFKTLRSLIDDPQLKQQYLILGSASGELIKQSSESLAGRLSYLELTPFTYQEVDHLEQLWIRGGFPRSYLAKDIESSFRWREDYIRTFLEQDIPNLGIQIPPQNLRRFWLMLTHYHGNIFNSSELGRSLAISHNTVRYYLDILSGALMVRQLQPWFENIKKRQVKSPKIYFRDSGIYHALLGIKDKSNLLIHPKLGASWEGFAMEEIIRAHQANSENCYFWATHSNAELDLLIMKEGKRLGFEFKYADAPKLTPSMQIAHETLGLHSLTVIYPGEYEFTLAKHIQVCGLKQYLENL